VKNFYYRLKVMQVYDLTVRELLTKPLCSLLEHITGEKIKSFLDPSFPSVKERRADLLLEVENGKILHVEVQSTNDFSMPHRMLEYRLLIKNKYPDRKVQQMVLYIGDEPCRISASLEEEGLIYRYQVIDIREIPCDVLLESERAEDLVIAFLCRITDKSELFRRLKERLENLDSRERADFLAKVLTILGLRPMLKEEVLSFVKEVGRMPITVRLEKELVENFPVIGDLVRRGIQEGLREGIQRGKQEALIGVLEARFGEVEESLKERIKGIEEVKKLEELLISAIRANDLEEFRKEIAED
jgi:predicted transposase YdaD